MATRLVCEPGIVLEYARQVWQPSHVPPPHALGPTLACSPVLVILLVCCHPPTCPPPVLASDTLPRTRCFFWRLITCSSCLTLGSHGLVIVCVCLNMVHGPGYACPMATESPVECPPNHYSTAGMEKCIRCPSPLPSYGRCKDSRRCCTF